MEAFPEIFCIVDTETTGMRAAFSRIIDIGIIRVEHGKVVKRYQTLLNPGVSLPSFITNITSLTDEDLSGAPTFSEVALEIQELLEGAVFVAHNVSFDYNFVQSEFERAGILWKATKLCSVNLSRALFPKEKTHNLDAIISRFSISISERHRALPDAEAVFSFFQIISKTLPQELISASLEQVLDQTTLRRSSSELSDNPGVYFFYGENQELLYVGKSKHIRTRVRSHFSGKGTGKEKRIQSETSLIETKETSGELSALLLESHLIKETSPLYNKALRKRKKLVIAKEIVNDQGYIGVELQSTMDITSDVSTLGVFRTMYQAKKKLEELASEYKLCQKICGLEKASGSCFAYQLRKCNGACLGKELGTEHNKRLQEAFAKRRMRSWPYSGPILITEQKTENSGTVFIINNWVLESAYTYKEGSYEPFLEQRQSFDYDTYKILARYILDDKNRKHITTLSSSEYKRYQSELTQTHDDIVYI